MNLIFKKRSKLLVSKDGIMTKPKKEIDYMLVVISTLFAGWLIFSIWGFYTLYPRGPQQDFDKAQHQGAVLISTATNASYTEAVFQKGDITYQIKLSSKDLLAGIKIGEVIK